MPERCYLLTGASGFVGAEVLREIARSEPESRVYALLRAPQGELERRAIALGWRSLSCRVVPVAADLTRLRAGLSPRDVERVCAETTHVIHAGANVRFDANLHRARQVNVFGTRQLVELAARMRRLERFVHVSTTFVCGDRPGALLEGPAPPGRFRNAYERSKFEAEEVSSRAMVSLPVTVVRPSIVAPALAAPASDARTTPGAHGPDAGARFLLLLRLYLTHGWRWVPGSPTSVVDLVPVDRAARALLRLATRPLGDGRWYHLAAGPRAATLRELGELASRAFRAPPLRFAPPRLFRAALRLAVWGRPRARLERAAPYVPYLSVRTRVDTTDSQRVLRELGVDVASSREVFAAMLERLEAEARSPISSAAARPASSTAHGQDGEAGDRFRTERFSASRVAAAPARPALGRRS